MILDVGCGVNPQGDVNVDYVTGFTRETTERSEGDFLNPHLIRNFVKADVHHLPFKTDAFDTAYSSHVIEHVDFPVLMLKEMVRVSKHKVVVRCPHRFGHYAKSAVHKHFFNLSWFYKTFKGFRVFSEEKYEYPIPFSGVLRFPLEIIFTVIVEKGKNPLVAEKVNGA